MGYPLRQIRKNVSFSLLAQIIYIFVSLIVNLIVPKYVDKLQFAYWQTYVLYASYVGVLHFGLLDGIILRYSQYDYDKLDKIRIRSMFLFMMSIITIIMIFIFSIGTYIIESPLKKVLPFVIASMACKNIFTYTSYTFQLTNRIKEYASLVILSRLFFCIALVGLIIVGINDYKWLCCAELIGEIAAVLICSNFNRGLYFGSILNFVETLIEAKKNISCGISLMIANWLSFLLTGLARIFIERHWDILTFGEISFAFSIISLFLTFVSAISVVLFPSLKRIDNDKMPKLYISIRRIISPIFIFALLCYFPICYLIESWLPNYSSSLEAFGILLPMVVYSSKIGLLTNNYLKALRKEKSILYINILSIAIAMMLYAISVFILDNITCLLFSIVLIQVVRCTLSEYIVSKSIDLIFIKEALIEFAMVVLFVLCVTLLGRESGFVLYLCSIGIYTAYRFRKFRDVVKRLSRKFDL